MTKIVGPAPARDWPDVLSRAQHSAARGEFDAADTTLAEFAKRYPTSTEALETSYWRAVYALDPSNRAESIPGAIASLDAYLADTRHREHVIEATTLRRLAGQLDALNRLAAGAIAQAKDANATASMARALSDARIDAPKPATPETPQTAADAEIKRLKDELAKANAELERIRRRLAQPPPKD
jgi:TolA-binding protein